MMFSFVLQLFLLFSPFFCPVCSLCFTSVVAITGLYTGGQTFSTIKVVGVDFPDYFKILFVVK